MDAAQSLATQLEISIGTNPQKRKYSRTAITWPRKRATQACHTCRFRRTKCDNTRPACTSCVRLGAECTYQDKDPSTFDAASLAILKRLDDLESIIQTGFNNEPSPSVHSHGIFSSPSITQDHSSSPMISQDNQWKLRFINLESVLEWPVFDRHNFHQRIHLLNPPNHSKPAPVPPISIEIDPQETESLIRTFFDYVNIFNPILEEEDIQECSNAACFNGIGWDAKSCLLVTPFFNKEPHVSPAGDFHQSEQFQRAESYFSAAQSRMGSLLCRSGVTEAQCFFLAGAYLMANLEPVPAWRMFVQALACCQGFFLETATEPIHDSEWNAKQRIYWTCFKSELELRLELNFGQKSVLDLSYPTLFPSPPDQLRTKDEAAWYFYLAEIALRRLKNRILDTVYRHDNSSSKSDIENAILDFEEQTNGW
ncbi:hypothetical protein N7462_011511 [Penicillium macrosclerotiorum]|uniref:uncharacterized protein n=1 Tax=Penicillium macrosclerotiorum TaxID=303699 RepID=UPI0025479E6B|nr:uncharacterized protein N7462_011511 [Penicillium macrosclerotiorum]KAJ5664698.1 hypothetical protein N7462_011511 [Penicillium macrosclerotiorum]